MKFGRGLECIMHCHQKGRLAYCCQNLPFGFSMLCGLSFLDNSSLFKNFHCKKLTSIDSCLLFGQKDFSIGSCIKKKLLLFNNQSGNSSVSYKMLRYGCAFINIFKKEPKLRILTILNFVNTYSSGNLKEYAKEGFNCEF